MATILQAHQRQFVASDGTRQIVKRAFRYLQSGFAVHLRGPAGTGKTTLAVHLAGLLGRPMVLIYGDEDMRSSQLVGTQSGYTRKKVVDNYIHSVLKIEDDLRQSWVDSRLTLAAKEGFTLIYDEFNRSRPEVNNVLLSVLEEKIIALPPDSSQNNDYVRVHPHFRAIFTSNPEEYAGVYETQDALFDRTVTIDIHEPDVETEKAIAAHKGGLSPTAASKLVDLLRQFRGQTESKHASLRPCLTLAQICRDHNIAVSGQSEDFRAVCRDVLLSRTRSPQAASLLEELLDRLP
ncbi:MAG: gas vesicle protein GvpN [Oscillatoriales cyanobacterium SM2_1_8]|nr:gas vesicle protein GvpN [Oscillatoriales cyanobacterium SM2_1_8]